MLKKLVQVFLIALLTVMPCCSFAVMAEEAPMPLVGSPVYSVTTPSGETEIQASDLASTEGVVNVAVTVTNPGTSGASAVKLVAVAVNNSSGELMTISDVDNKPLTAATSSVELKTSVNFIGSEQHLEYYVMDQNDALLFNSASMPVSNIRANATIKYVKLEWDTPKDDYNSVKSYRITRDGTFIGETTKLNYVDKFDSEKEDKTFRYGITAVDHGGLSSREKTIEVKTPAWASVQLMSDKSATTANSKYMDFVFVDFAGADSNTKDQSTEGGVWTDTDGKTLPYRKSVCYTSNGSPANTYMYFRADAAVITEDDHAVSMEITYLDKGNHYLSLHYFNSDGARTAAKIPLKDSGKWITTTLLLPDFSLAGAANANYPSSAQFRIFSQDTAQEIYISKVRLIHTADIGDDLTDGDPAQGAWVNFDTQDGVPATNCMTPFIVDSPINADETSRSVTYEGKNAQVTVPYTDASGNKATSRLYFRVSDEVVPNVTEHQEVTFKLTYYDDGATRVNIGYFNGWGPRPGKDDGPQQTMVGILSEGTPGWRTVERTVTDFSKGNTDSGWLNYGHIRVYSQDVEKGVYIAKFCVEPAAPVSPDTPSDAITVFMAGDSIAQYNPESAFPKTGWFQHLSKFFNREVNFENRAYGGMSARSYGERKVNAAGEADEAGEPAWTTLLTDAKSGDYVLLSFAHNDSMQSKTEEYTDPTLGSDVSPESGQYSYKYYLKKYVSEAQAKGVKPILVTSVESHKTDGDYTNPTFGAYADAMVALGAELSVPVININKAVCETLTDYGMVNDKVFFRLVSATDLGTAPLSDGVHLRDYGGLYVSYLFSDLLRKNMDTSLTELKSALLSDYSQPASVFINDRFNHADNIIITNDAPGGSQYLVSAEAVLNGFGAENVMVDANGFSADVKVPVTDPSSEDIFTVKTVSATVGSVEYHLAGSPITKSYAPKLIDDTIYIDPLFFEEICGGNVYYNEFMKLTTILTGIDTASMPYEDNFDNFVGSSTQNIVPVNWQSRQFAAGSSYAIAAQGDTAAETDKAAKIVRANADVNAPYYLLKQDFSYTSSQVVTMRLKTTNTTDTKKLMMQLQKPQSETGKSPMVEVARLRNGSVSSPKASNGASQTLTTDWFTLKVLVYIVDDVNNPTTTVFSYLVNERNEDVFLGSFQTETSSGVFDLMRIEVGAANDELYIDDVKIEAYTGGVPSTPDEPDPTPTPTPPPGPDTPDIDKTSDATQGAWADFTAANGTITSNCMTPHISDTTSEGTAFVKKAERNGRSIPQGAYFYFKLDDGVIGTEDREVTFTLDYYDDGINSVKVGYSSDTSQSTSFTIATSGQEGWRRYTAERTNYSIGNVKSGWLTYGHVRIYGGNNNAVIISGFRMQTTADITTPVENAAEGAWVNFNSPISNMQESNCLTPYISDTGAAGTVSVSKDGRFARSVPAGGYFYFKIGDGVIAAEDRNVTFTIDYYDDGANSVKVGYSSDTSDSTSFTIETSGQAGWRTYEKNVTNYSIDNVRPGWLTYGHIRIYGGNSNPVVISGIKIKTTSV